MSIFRSIGSQPTYEELKLYITSIRVYDIPSSQPTYEELKQILKSFPDGNLSSSQPTYEELKHSFFFVLPTRL